MNPVDDALACLKGALLAAPMSLEDRLQVSLAFQRIRAEIAKGSAPAGWTAKPDGTVLRLVPPTPKENT